MAEVPTKSLERYDVLDRIAVGGMAEVFLAKAYGAHGFEKTLAIKRILPELARDPEFEERFIAEAKVAVKLSHTNVVSVFDFGRFAGSLFIAMEYVDGLDLAALLRRYKEMGRLLPVPAAFHIAVELARGLDFAHSHGVVHRDVSPSNILLSRAGEVKIADFGIAVAAQPMIRPAPGAKRKVMGKWRYMSPEQARGEPVDTRSDLFSMAVVMYELLTGEKLFPGDEVEDIVRNINDMPLPRPSETRRDLPRRLDEILLPALARESSRRPARAALIQRAMTELSYESSIVATALDVADAVAVALDVQTGASTSGRHSLDQIIRQQIAENFGRDNATGRRTALTTEQHSTAVTASKLYRDRGEPLVITREAIILGAEQAQAQDEPVGEEGNRDRVTEPVQLQDLGGDEQTGTGLRRRIDPDGITHLELDTTHAGVPRAMRAQDSGVRKLGIATTDPASSKLLRAAGKDEPEVAAEVAPPAPPASRRWIGAVAAAGLVAIGLWFVLRGGDGATGVAVIDARGQALIAIDGGAPVPAIATLEIESDPAGATGSAGDAAIPATPSTIEIPSGVALTVRLERAGYRPWIDEGVIAKPGEIVRLRATMIAARAELHVKTDPPGARVTLGGKLIGETPLDRVDLEPAAKADLVIARDGFDPVRTSVALTLDAPVTVERTLVPIQRFGTIDLAMAEGWGEIYLKGKKLKDRAPVKGLRLPVGTHKLTIKNPLDGKKTVVEVDVVEGKSRLYSARFP